ncbi:hypothetical protein H6775_03575 [Candidatus Nomurabacteria bacterium]|nr:hypothetical protein [Candidatus Nomurabacteria bacterium]
MKKCIDFSKKKFFLLSAFILGSFFISFDVDAAENIKVPYKKVDLLSKIAINIVNPIIVMFFGLALAYFVFGVLRFIVGGENEEVRQKGRDHILWGLVGMGMMFGAWSILRIVTNTFSLSDQPLNLLQGSQK